MSIYVGNLAYEATQEQLEKVFGKYGAIKRVYLPTNYETNRPRGFAIVEMGTAGEEGAAIAGLDGAEWMGRKLKVNPALPRQEKSGGGDRRGY